MALPAPTPPVPAARSRRVDDPAWARALLSLDRDATLALFMTGAYTLTQAAEKLDVGLSTLHYRVQRLLDLGLLEVEREEARRGRPQKVYRAVAERFEVPFELSDHESLEALLLQQAEKPQKLVFANVIRAMTEHTFDWDVIVRVVEELRTVEISLTPRGDARPIRESLLQPDMPAIGLEWTSLSLPFREAKELQREMVDLLERYKERAVDGEQAYLVQMALAPLRVS